MWTSVHDEFGSLTVVAREMTEESSLPSRASSRKDSVQLVVCNVTGSRRVDCRLRCNHPTGPRNAQKDDQAADLGYCWQRAILDQVEQVPRRNTRHPHALRHDIEIQDLLGIANRWLIMIDIRDGGRVDKFLAKARGTCQRR